MSDTGYPGLARPRPKSASWRPWQMASFDLPEPPPLPPEPQELAAPEPEPDPAELLAQWRAAAEREGFAAGRKAGHAEGMAAGRSTGYDSGHEQGYKAGHAEGLAAARVQGQDEAERLRELSAACAESLEALEEDVGQGLLTLALDVARQVIRVSLAEQSTHVLAAVREVLHAGPANTAPLRLWLHPEDLELVRLHLADELKESGWRMLPDDTLLRGGCRAETAYGDIDATLQTRWQRVAASLGRASNWEPDTA